MAFAFNPITGKLDLVGSGGGSATTDASLLTSGTLALARLDPLVARDDLNNNFTVGQSITAAANTSALTASYSVTGTNTTPIVSLTGTWNTTGIARGILLNITDTASNADSVLAEFQRNGTSVASITKTGAYNINAVGLPFSGIGWTGSQHLAITHNNLVRGIVNSLGITANGSNTNLGFNFAASTDSGTSFHSRILTDGAGTVALRNGGTAASPVPQNFRVYNWGDTTNFERGFMRWNSNTLEIGTEAGGTGTGREVNILSPTAIQLIVATNNYVNIRVGGSNRFLSNTTENISYQQFRISSGRLIFNTASASFPSLKQSSTTLQCRLADDSAFAPIQGRITTETAYTAGIVTPTGWITLYDSTGTAYRVPCLV
jgi:hypothetical protein